MYWGGCQKLGTCALNKDYKNFKRGMYLCKDKQLSLQGSAKFKV